MIAAAVLTKEEGVLEGCPKISDVEDMAEIVRSLGGTVWWERNALHLNCEKIEKSRVEGALSKRLRASLLFLGSLLARTGEAYLAGAGGCRIGKRPTDLHQRAMFLKAMGAEIPGEGTEQITVYGRQGKRLLSGCRYRVPGDRIAAGTYLLMGAATRGHLTLSGAPLDEMGAVLSLYQKIGGQYTRKSGTLVADSKNVQHAVPYVETEEYPGFPTDLQSLYLAAAMTLEGKSCICENVFEDRLRTAEELQKMGGTLQICGKWLTAEKSRLHGAEVVSQDLRGGAALVSAALAAEGFSTIRQTELIERGYERFPETLRELGAKIIVEKEI